MAVIVAEGLIEVKDAIIKTLKTENLKPFLKNRNSLHARLNSHYKVWSYKKKKHKKTKAYRKSVSKGPTVKTCLLTLDLKPLRS